MDQSSVDLLAQIINDSKNIVAFTGGFPINKPKYVFTIVIDGPKPQKFSANRNTAGWVVAPIIGKLVNRIAPILKIIDDEFQLSRIKIILTKCKPPITGFDGEVSIVRVFENN